MVVVSTNDVRTGASGSSAVEARVLSLSLYSLTLTQSLSGAGSPGMAVLAIWATKLLLTAGPDAYYASQVGGFGSQNLALSL